MMPLPSPFDLAEKHAGLKGVRDSLSDQQAAKERALAEIQAYLELDGPIQDALSHLSSAMFGKIANLLETNLTLALQEILEQDISLRVVTDHKNNRASIEFHVERNGHEEDIMRGQGGSVANILSVGLRMFALKTLDPAKHRRFLLLDEQDCWLRPDLVPRFVKMIHDAGEALGFQTIMISHHDTGMFSQYADKIYKFTPGVDGVEVREWSPAPAGDGE